MEDIQLILKKYWGYEDFRPMQREIIESVLTGHDTLGLMPTGGGKSITFQVPGLALGGLTLVITPLVALMKDQVDNLRSHHIKAAFIHAGMPWPEQQRVWQGLVHGGTKFLYISPERLQNERFCQELRMLHRVTLIVVDEAHCISQWGHDFRPPYLQIAKLRKILGDIPFMAVTASATPRVADDIRTSLQFRNERTFASSFARPNISYVVRKAEDKLGQIAHILSRVPGTSIVYVRSRRRTVEIADALSRMGLQAAPFHAGMEYEVKEQNINDWKNGAIRVMVATNAFGMGIDKPDVRTVIHYDLPPSMEEYYQEAGRAGRDGKQAYAVLLHDSYDIAKLRRRLTEAFPTRETIERVYELLCNFLRIGLGEGYDRLIEFDLERFLHTFSMQEAQVKNSLALLEGAGYLGYIDETENASRAMFVCEKEELYSLPYISPFTDGILRALLRNCPGIFADFVYFSENRIAFEAGCTPQQLYDVLLQLNRNGIVNYVPRRRTPYIHVLTARELPEQLIIPHKVYQLRKEQMKERIEAMIAYINDSSACRTQKILSYFGQEEAPCGTCDNCRSARSPLTAKRRDSLQEELLQFISSCPQGATMPQIMHRFGMHADAIADLTEFLTDNGRLHCANDIYTLQ